MTAIILIAVLVGLVWGTVYVCRGSLLAGCLVLLVIGYCFGHSLISFDLGRLPLTLDRLALGGLIIAYFVQRWLGTADPKPPTRTDVAMLALAAWLTLRTLTTDWSHDAEGKYAAIWRLMAGFLMPMIIYWIVRQSRVTQRGVTGVYALLTVFGVYLAVTGLAEIAGQWWLVYPTYIRDPDMGIHFGRARGPMLQSQSLGLYLGMCLLCAWIWRPRLSRVGQLVLIPLFLAFLAAIYCTYTRCVWMGVGLGGLVVLALSLRGKWRPLVVGSICAAGLLVAVLNWEGLIAIKREDGVVAARSSAQMRLSFTYVSWTMFLDRPLLGHGFGRYAEAVRPYLQDRATDLNLESLRDLCHHNTFLSLLTETGLIGMALYLIVLAGWGRGAWCMWRDRSAPDWVRRHGLLMLGALGVYCCPAMFFDLTLSPHDHWMFFFLAGVTAALRPLAGAVTRPAELFATPSTTTGPRGLSPAG